MPERNLIPLLATVVALGCTATEERPAPPITLKGRDLAEWKTSIAPDEEDLAWLEIPWIPTLAEGLQHAREEEKPLLLWLMNGHPLGGT